MNNKSKDKPNIIMNQNNINNNNCFLKGNLNINFNGNNMNF